MGRTADAIPLVLAGVRGLPLLSLVRQKLQRGPRAILEFPDERHRRGRRERLGALCRPVGDSRVRAQGRSTGGWRMTDEFRGKVAIVTGGGAGIGLAAAGRLSREGASVVICSDREDQARQTAGGLREEGLEVRGMRGDVTSSTDMEGLVDFAVEVYGGVDVLVNSAGVQRYGTVTETEEDVWDEVLDI